eukprot:GILI01002051.1.p1 GENE.GILI01002051.1~~GILI01002051.1.p1  ORF type:complete len:617 (-),score=25.48 GILI01002051.1:52-1875(-)
MPKKGQRQQAHAKPRERGREIDVTSDIKVQVKSGMTKSQIAQKKLKSFNHNARLEERKEMRERNDEEVHQEAEDYSDTANERVAEYRKGGYHPVVVNDLYSERYRVVRKLGWGYFSTVWLVWDYAEKRFQAMKIQKSDKQYREAAYDEIRLLKDIMKADSTAERCCARMCDFFEHTGPNGIHICMIFDILGENLLSLIERYEHRGIPLPIVKSLTKEILIGLDHVHTINIIHTDLKPENVLLAQPKHAILHEMKKYTPPSITEHIKLEEREVSTMTKSQRKRYYQKLAQKKKDADSGVTTHADPTAVISMEAKDVESDGSDTDEAWEVERFHHCCVADFGNSCYSDRPITDEVQTRQYRAPEVIVGNGYGPAIDIWSCACMVFELLTGEFLFDPKQDDNGIFSRDEDHLALMTELLGGMPDCISKGNGCYKDRFYDARGKLRNIHDLRPSTLSSVLHRRYRFTQKKSEEIANFLLPMLEADPKYRASAGEMLIEFQDWFEVQEDDYEPLCKRTEDADVDVESRASGEGDDERSENSGDSEDFEEDTDADWYHNHPILNPDSLAEKGLTIHDMMVVMRGENLDNESLNSAAQHIMEELLIAEKDNDES